MSINEKCKKMFNIFKQKLNDFLLIENILLNNDINKKI